MLKQELENFQDLLEEDPDCKWALYTKVLIMKTIDPAKYHQEIVKDFEMLCQIGMPLKSMASSLATFFQIFSTKVIFFRKLIN